ncbi:MAG TPA: ABC transporter permease [Vicinamibacterales bacterium]
MIHDIKYAVRSLTRTRAFTAAVVLTLGLGIGANTSIFTIVNAVILRPLPYAEPDRLVRIRSELRAFGATDTGTASQELFDYQARTDLFSGVAGLFPVNANVTGGSEPERVDVLLVSANYFSLLGAAPALGRVFGPQDEAAGIAPVIIVSDAYWRRRLGADPNALGKTITVDGDPAVLVGVMPAGFRHPGRTLQSDVQVWSPAGFRGAPFAAPNRSRRFLEGCLARLQPGVTIEQVQARLDAYGAQVRRQFPEDYPARIGWNPTVISLHTDVVGRTTAPMLILLSGVALLLLIVCANVAHLVIARASERQQEMAIRQALGASGSRLLRQMLSESLVLSAAAGALGLLLAAWGLQALIALAPNRIARLSEVSIDGTAIFFTGLVSAMTALLFGIAPAAQFRQLNTPAIVRESGRSAGVARVRLRAGLVIAQIAIATILLVGAGLLVRTVRELLAVPIGFETDGLTTARIWLPLPNDAASGKYATPESRAVFAREVIDRVSREPGVDSAALSSQIPMAGYNAPLFFEREARGNDQGARPVVHDFQVSTKYFDTLGISLLRGRAFTADDRAGASEVAIISEAAVRAFWKDENPIGTRIRFSPDTPWMTVVGVAADVRNRRLTEAPQPILYRPLEQSPGYALAVLIRARGNPPGLGEAIARDVRAVDSDVPVYAVRTMNDWIGAAVAERRFLMRLLLAFGAAAVGIALVGIYGVMAYAVSRRTREIGIRMAIGANQKDVSRMVVRQGMTLTAAGLAVGLAGAVGLSRLITSQLFGVQPTDPATLASVLTLMVAVAVAAGYLPARRAARVDPMVVLRTD